MKKTIKNAMSSLTAKLAALLFAFTCAGTAWGATVATEDSLVAALSGSDAVITLNADIQMTATLVIGRTVTLDLGSHTLKPVQTSGSQIDISSGAEPIIQNGTINIDGCNATGEAMIQIGPRSGSSVLTLSNVRVEGANYSSANSVFRIFKPSTVNLNSCVIELNKNTYSGGGTFYGDDTTSVVNITDSTLNLTDVVRGLVNVTANINNSTMTVKASTQGGLDNGINNCALTVTDSTLTIKDGSGRGITARSGAPCNFTGNSVVTITGNGEGDIVLNKYGTGPVIIEEGVTLTAADVRTNASSIIRDGNGNAIALTEGGLAVTPPVPVAKIGETKYKTLAEAFAAAKLLDGDSVEIIVLSDLPLSQLSGASTVGKEVVLKAANPDVTLSISGVWKLNIGAQKTTLDGFKLDFGTSGWSFHGFEGAFDLTVQNCEITGFMSCNGGESLKVLNSTFEFAGNYQLMVGNLKNLYVEECTFTGGNRCAKVYSYGGSVKPVNGEFKNCEFTCTAQKKAAVEITLENSTVEAADLLNVTLTNCKQTGCGTGEEMNLADGLWNFELKGTNKGNGTVWVDGVQKYPFRVTFKNWNDDELVTVNVPVGEVPVYPGETPTKPSDPSNVWTFSGWDPALTAVTTGEQTYTAQFTSETPVAKIGDEYFATLQSAVEAAQALGGEVTIRLLADISGAAATATIPEVANFKLTIDGAKAGDGRYTITDATLTIDGKRTSGGSVNNGAAVTLQNIDFAQTIKKVAVNAGETYPHDVTIQNCSFTGTSENNDWWAIDTNADAAYYWTLRELVFENCRMITTKAFNYSGNRSTDEYPYGLYASNLTGNNVKAGINNIKTDNAILIENCTISASKYAFRDAPEDYAGTITLKNNNITSTSEESDEGALVVRGGKATASVNVESGAYSGKIVVLNNKENVLNISGGIFSAKPAASYVAEGYMVTGNTDAETLDAYPYTVAKAVAQIGSDYYLTFADAIVAAEAYKTEHGDYPVITVLDATAEQTDDGWMFSQDGQRLVRKVAMVTTNVDNYATTNYYASAAEAFSAAESAVANKSGTGSSYAYVTLLADDTLPGDATTVLKSNHGSTDRRYIDLNGHTLTAPKGISLEYKSGGFQVYLQDGSAGQTGRVVNPTADDSEAFVFMVGSSVSLAVEGGAIVAKGEGTALKTTGGGSITLKGGSVTADPAGRALNAAGTNKITAYADSSVSVTGTLGAPTGVLNLQGGTFTANAANGELFDVGETGSVAVSGGSYSIRVADEYIATGYKDAGQTAVVENYYTVTKEVYTIRFVDENDAEIVTLQVPYNDLYKDHTGDGKIPAIPVKASDDPAFYYTGAWSPAVTTSTRATGNATHKLTYTLGKYNFQYGDGLYTNSFANAYKNVADGGTITVCTEAFALTSTTLGNGKSVTVDLNGSTLSMNSTGMLTVSGEGTKVTFVNGTVKYGSGTTARDALVKVTSPAEVAFEGVTLQGASYYTTAVSVASGASAAFSGECVVTMPSGKQAVTAADGGTVAISGGLYSTEVPAAYCAADYVPTTEPVLIDNVPYYTVTTMGVAKIERTGEATQYFPTLEAAIGVAQSGDTITLLADVEQTAGITIAKTVTLDLNGKSVTGSGSLNSLFNIGANGVFSVNDSVGGGKISNTQKAINFSASGNDTTTRGGKFVLQGGIIENTADGNSFVNSAIFSANGNSQIEILGGSVSGKFYGIYLNAKAESVNGIGYVNVSGGTITGGLAAKNAAAAGVFVGGTTITVEDEGRIIGMSGNGAASAIKCNGTTGSVKVKGGSICSYNNGAAISPASGWTYEVSGGWFAEKVTASSATAVPEDYCAEDYVPSEETKSDFGDGLTYHTVKLGVAKIGTKAYDSFAAAAAARTSNDDVITLIQNAEAYTMTVGETLKVAKNGKTFSKPTIEGAYVVKSADADGVTTYSVVDAKLMYTNTSGKITYYEKFTQTSISGSGTYKLLDDAEVTARIAPGILAKDVTLDLNGHTLTSTATDYTILLSRAGSASAHKTFALVDTSTEKGGKLVANSAASAAIQAQGKYNDITIGEGVTVDGGCVAVLSENQTLNVSGTINGGSDFAIATNGSSTKNVVININDGAVLTSSIVAMYLPAAGTTTISGGTVSGKTGIEVRAGTLNVTGGTIKETASSLTVSANGSGSTVLGAAVAISQHTTDKPITVNISGGTLDATAGGVALWEGDTVASETPSAGVTATVTGGTFYGSVTNENDKITIPALVDGNPNPARFSEQDKTQGVPADYKLVPVDPSATPVMYKIVPKDYVAQVVREDEVVGKYESLAEAFAAAEVGDTVQLIADAELDDSLDVASDGAVITLDLNGKKLSAAEGKVANDKFTANSAHDYLIGIKYGTTLQIVDSVGGGAIDGSKLIVAVKLTTKGETPADEDDSAALVVGSEDDVDLNNFTISGDYYGISGNGSRHQTSLEVFGGTIQAVNESEGTGIYQPQDGYLLIAGGTIKGYDSAVEVRAGEANFWGGNYVVTGNSAYSVSSNGNGTTIKGAAIAIDPHVTGKELSVTVLDEDESGVPYSFTVPQGGVRFAIANAENVDIDSLLSVEVTGLADVFGQSFELPEGYDWYLVGEDVYTIKRTVAERLDANGDHVAYYATLEDAMDAVEDGETVKLLKDVELTDRLFVNAGATPAYAGSNNRYATTSENKAVTLGLNGFNITSESNIALAGGSLTITGKGKISTTNDGLAPIEVRGTGDLAAKRTLTIGSDVTLEGGEYGLNVFGSNDAQKNLIDVTVNGTVNGTLFVLGNLKNAENAINIVVNGKVAAPAGEGDNVNVGIALNGNANVTVNNGATVSGDSGIEVRAGTLTVNGGTITGTASEYSYKANGSGSTTKGAAIVVAQHTTKLPTAVTLNGGTLNGVKTIGVTDVNGNMDNVEVLAKQGFTENSAIPDDYKWVETEIQGVYELVPKDYVAQIGDDGEKFETLAEAFAAAQSGETVKLLKDIELTNRLFVNAGATPAYAGKNNRFATTSENKTLTLDMNDHDITGSSNIALAGGSLTITGSGTISTTTSGLAPIEVRGTGSLTSKRTLTIDTGVTLEGKCYGVNVFGSNSADKNVIDVNVNGTVKGMVFVLGNLTNSANEININVAGTVDASAAVGEESVHTAIAQCGYSTVTVSDGAVVKGESGIETRAGTLTVNGGAITATAAYNYAPNSNGTTTKGAAIAVAQYGADRVTSVTINNGTLSGEKKIAVTDVNNDMSKVKVFAKEADTTPTVIPTGYSWAESTEKPGMWTLVKQLASFTYPIEGTAGIPVDLQWLADNLEDVTLPILETQTDDIIAALSENGDNGIPVWQSYVLGLDPKSATSQLRLAATAKDATTVTITGIIDTTKFPEIANVTVTFRLASRNADGTWSNIDGCTGAASPSFDVALDAVAGKTLAMFADIVTE